MYVIVRDNDVSKAIRLLKRKLHNEGVLKEVRDRKSFVSRGEKKRAEEKAGKASSFSSLAQKTKKALEPASEKKKKKTSN